MRTERKEHRKLRGGKGKIVTYTTTMWLRKWFFFGEPNQKQLIKLVFEPFASVGKHEHIFDSEIYFTFNRRILFNGRKHWFPINICWKGQSHSVVNDSSEPGNLYALKF